MQPSEGKLHLRFDTDPAGHSETGRLSNQISQQCRLADTRFSPHNEDAALTASHVRYELPQDLQLADPAEQPGRRTHCHAERLEQADQGTHREPHWWEPNDKNGQGIPRFTDSLEGSGSRVNICDIARDKTTHPRCIVARAPSGHALARNVGAQQPCRRLSSHHPV